MSILLIFLFVLFFIYLFYCTIKNTNKNKIFTFGELKNNDIQLRYISNFLNQNECSHLIDIAKDKLSRSKVIDNKEDHYDDSRTSYSYYLDVAHDNIVKDIEHRVSSLLQISPKNIEALQIVRYENGQEFKEHFDWFQNDYRDKIKNQRQYTFFVYLNDITNGGETSFPKLNLSFKPKAGHALFWENCKSYYNCYDKAIHQGKAPKDETKYGLNIWINFNKLR